MKVFRHVAHVAPATRPRVVTVGRFDGVHVGHRDVLSRCRAIARERGGEVAVVLLPVATPALTSVRDRLERLRSAGVDTVLFAAPSHVSAALERLGGATAANVVVAGEGSAAASDGLVDVVRAVTYQGEPVTSDRIRAAVARGDLASAAAMLGRDHAVAGRVIHGHHRGAGLGIPTANLRIRDVQLPPDGVYAVRAQLQTQHVLGVANLGFNPTFGNRARSLETHLLDFAADLYGQRLRVAFVARLRDERKFPDVQALLAQIHDDIAAARRLFDGHGG